MRLNTRQHEAHTPCQIASLLINSTKQSLRSLAHIRITLHDCICHGNVFVEQCSFQWVICEDVVCVDHWWRERKRCEPRVICDLYTAHCCLPAHHYNRRVMAVKPRIRLGDVDEHAQAEEWGDLSDWDLLVWVYPSLALIASALVKTFNLYCQYSFPPNVEVYTSNNETVVSLNRTELKGYHQCQHQRL